MTQQLNLDLSKELTNAGIKRAVDHANRVHESWSDKAYTYLIVFVKSRKRGERFMMEDIRQDASTLVPTPPNYRAWGAIARRAIQDNIILKVGARCVKNSRAHKATANEYIRNI
jgi:hypothetical protein